MTDSETSRVSSLELFFNLVFVFTTTQPTWSGLRGITVIAAGIKLAVVRSSEPATVATAVLLAGGVAAYAAGLSLFRWLLGSGPLSARVTLAIIALPTAFIGIALSPLWQLVDLVALLAAVAANDSILRTRAARP